MYIYKATLTKWLLLIMLRYEFKELILSVVRDATKPNISHSGMMQSRTSWTADDCWAQAFNPSADLGYPYFHVIIFLFLCESSEVRWYRI
jgi:hypothetical protein